MYNKIAVLCANALGDFIFILPALKALRETYPDAEIVLLGKELHQRLLENRPSPVDRVIVIPRCPGVGEPSDFLADKTRLDDFFAQMQQENFDVAFQMHGGGRFSNAFVRKLGARLTVGSRTPDAEPLDISVPYATYFSEILRYLELVSYVGAFTTATDPEIRVTSADLYTADMLLEESAERPIAVIQPGASDPQCCWPVDKFARLTEELVALGYFVCFNGVAGEQETIDSTLALVAEDATASVRDFCGTLSFPALIGLMSRSAVVISNDTGPLHLAYAIGTPTIGLYWAPKMIAGTPMTLCNSRPLISWTTHCTKCGASFREQSREGACDHDVSFIAEIEVIEVIDALHQLKEYNQQMVFELASLHAV